MKSDKSDKKKKMTKQMGFDELTVLSHKSPLAWSKDDVALWIKSIGFPEYQKLFIEHDVSGEVIFSLDIVDLKTMGVSQLGHRKKIMHEVSNLSHSIKVAGDDQKGEVKKELREEEEEFSDSTDTENSQASKKPVNPSIIHAVFVLSGDETKMHLKKTYTFKKVKAKVSAEMGAGGVKFEFEGKEIVTEKEWQEIAQNRSEMKIFLTKSNPNEPCSIEKGVIDSLVDATVLIDNKGIILYCNEKVTKELGYSKTELIGQNVKMLMPDEYSSKHGNSLFFRPFPTLFQPPFLSLFALSNFSQNWKRWIHCKLCEDRREKDNWEGQVSEGKIQVWSSEECLVERDRESHSLWKTHFHWQHPFLPR